MLGGLFLNHHSAVGEENHGTGVEAGLMSQPIPGACHRKFPLQQDAEVVFGRETQGLVPHHYERKCATHCELIHRSWRRIGLMLGILLRIMLRAAHAFAVGLAVHGRSQVEHVVLRGHATRFQPTKSATISAILGIYTT